MSTPSPNLGALRRLAEKTERLSPSDLLLLASQLVDRDPSLAVQIAEMAVGKIQLARLLSEANRK